ncbi:MAG: hypothetical protein R3A10_04795 [Caldilineaceae bacterium]
MNTASVILAAGFGTRMKSSIPKVMHPILGRPLVGWAGRGDSSHRRHACGRRRLCT